MAVESEAADYVPFVSGADAVVESQYRLELFDIDGPEYTPLLAPRMVHMVSRYHSRELANPLYSLHMVPLVELEWPAFLFGWNPTLLAQFAVEAAISWLWP